MQLFELSVNRMRLYKVLTGEDLEIVSRDVFPENKQIIYRGRNYRLSRTFQEMHY